MDLNALIARCRLVSQDLRSPFLWDDSEWTEWLNEAEAEACIRARLIEDEAIIGQVFSAEPYVDLPERAFLVCRVFLGSRKLVLTSRHDLDLDNPHGWESETGDPVACYRSVDRLRMYPVPISDDEARIVAFCTPETEMSDDSDTPSIASRLHVKLIDWALRCAYLKDDPDTQDVQRAERYEEKFERTFGPRPNESEVRRLSITSVRRARGSFV